MISHYPQTDFVTSSPSLPSDPPQMARFTMWNISFIKGSDVKIRDRFTLIPRDSLSADERKWCWLMLNGHRDMDEYVENDSLENYKDALTGYKETTEDENDDDMDDLTDLMSENTIDDDEKHESNVLINKTMVNNTMIDVPKMLLALTACDDCPRELIRAFYAFVRDKGESIGFGLEWVKATDIEKKMKDLTTPKKKMSDDQKKKMLKDRQKSNEKIAIEMGYGDKKARIGELMSKLRESVEAPRLVASASLNAIEAKISSKPSTDALVDLVHQIGTKLAIANNDGVRLIDLRGQIFCLYQLMNPSATNASTAEVFNVSTTIISTSRSFTNLLHAYPKLRKTSLAFTIIVNNMVRIKKHLEKASDDDKIFWTSTD